MSYTEEQLEYIELSNVNEKLEQQRDDLLAACERIGKLADKAFYQSKVQRGITINEIGNIAEATIAKVKEGSNENEG